MKREPYAAVEICNYCGDEHEVQHFYFGEFELITCPLVPKELPSNA